MIVLFAAAALMLTQTDPEIQARMTRDHTRCIAAAAGSAERRLTCLMNETWRQDDQLNAVYRRLRATTPASRWTSIRDTQRSWIRLRDNYCATTRRSAGSGTSASLAFADCYLTETIERRVWLENQRN